MLNALGGANTGHRHGARTIVKPGPRKSSVRGVPPPQLSQHVSRRASKMGVYDIGGGGVPYWGPYEKGFLLFGVYFRSPLFS